MAHKVAKFYSCPTEFTLSVLGGKWKKVILCYLNQRPCRYSELRRLLPKVSDKVLAQRLRDLKNAGLVVHEKNGRDSLGRYALSPSARSLNRVRRISRSRSASRLSKRSTTRPGEIWFLTARA
jgi:DNA-binding HxlR family transcriptional regulator